MPAGTTHTSGDTWAALDRDVPIPADLHPHTLPPGRRRPLATLQVRSFLGGGDLVVSAGRFHRLLVEHVSLTSVGAGGSFGQFRRLACSLSIEVRDRPLRLLERVVPPAQVPPGVAGALAGEVRDGLDAIGEIATDGWVLAGATERRVLALHPDGVTVHLLESGTVAVQPGRGPVVRHDGREYRVDGIVDGQVRCSQVAGEHRAPTPTLLDQVAAALGPDLDVSPCPATHVFADDARRFADLLDGAGRSGDAVVVFDADPRAVGLLRP